MIVKAKSMRPQAVCLWRHLLTMPSRILLAGVLTLGIANAASAQVSIIRDAEVESMIRDFAAPLVKAAGLGGLSDIHIVADRRFNAFVVEDGSLFINYGTILDVKTPIQLKSILAHEIGHVAGGHLARLRERAETVGRLQALAMVLGAGAIIAGSGGGDNSQIGGIASALILASQSVGTNALMAYRQSEETTADSAALKLLDATGQSAQGLIETFEYLQGQESAGFSPYLRTHPLASDRIEQVRTRGRQSRNWSKSDPASDVARLLMAQAKLSGFLESQQTVLNRFPNSDKSTAARYARIIAAYKGGAGKSALQQMASLASDNGSNPYLQELLGQMYFETGDAAAALKPLKRAVDKAPKETEIRILYGQALVDAGGKKNLGEAVLQLTRAALEDRRSIRARTILARAHALLGNTGDATLAAAEIALLRDDKGTALGLARKAQSELAEGSPSWFRAGDILSLQH